MTVVRQIMSALMAVTIAWAGAAAAQPAHAHDLSGVHQGVIHALTIHAEADHLAASHAHGYDHDTAVHAPVDDGSAPPEHENEIFHVHTGCFVALEADYPSFGAIAIEQVAQAAELIVSLHTRSIGPADRPPRTFL